MLVAVEVALIMLRESLVLEDAAVVEMAPQRIILEKLEQLILAAVAAAGVLVALTLEVAVELQIDQLTLVVLAAQA